MTKMHLIEDEQVTLAVRYGDRQRFRIRLWRNEDRGAFIFAEPMELRKFTGTALPSSQIATYAFRKWLRCNENFLYAEIDRGGKIQRVSFEVVHGRWVEEAERWMATAKEVLRFVGQMPGI